MQTEFFDVAVAGGTMRAARLGSGTRLVLGIHGITGSCMQLVPLSRRLDGAVTVAAPDLRGRGHSNHLPGPFGMRAHADDCAALLSRLSEGPVVVVGESMGAYVAVVLAARHPELVERLVLVDGGFTLALPPGLDPEAVLEAVLGPALARLDQVFPTKEAYFDFWRAHPALVQDWGPDYEAYFDYDLEPVAGGFRSRARPEPVRIDGFQHIVEPALIEDSLRVLRCPVRLLRAPRNLLDQPVPALPDEAIDPWRSVLGDFSDAVVEDTNHYTLMFGERGVERIAGLVTAGRAQPKPAVDPGGTLDPVTESRSFPAWRAHLLSTHRRPGAATAGRGVHHLAMICSDVEQTIAFYQEVLGFPLVEVIENRDYPGSTHFFFDIGNGNLLAFFDFPGLALEQAVEAHGALQHVALSVDQAHLDAVRRRLDAAGTPYLGPDRGLSDSIYVKDPDGIQIELLAQPLRRMEGAELGA